MSEEELKDFNCDCNEIDWRDQHLNSVHGMAIWCLKEDKVEPSLGFK